MYTNIILCTYKICSYCTYVYGFNILTILFIFLLLYTLICIRFFLLFCTHVRIHNIIAEHKQILWHTVLLPTSMHAAVMLLVILYTRLQLIRSIICHLLQFKLWPCAQKTIIISYYTTRHRLLYIVDC